MQIVGGKTRQGKAIVKAMLPYLEKANTYVEPFCGAMGVASEVAKVFNGRMLLYDSNPYLVFLWNSLLSGWDPPSSVSEEEYRRVRSEMRADSPMTAFCGHGMSWGGKWWRGYARSAKGGGPGQARALLTKRANALRNSVVTISESDYLNVCEISGVYYLDPPYRGTESSIGYYGKKFDNDRFWEYARERTTDGMVFVTEYTYPDDFVPVANLNTNTNIGKERKRDEMLLMHRSQMMNVTH